MNLIDYIKNNYNVILIFSTIIMIVLLLLISFLKKRNKKKNKGLMVSSENTKNDQIYKNIFVIYRKNIQEYVSVLYDENGNQVLFSEPQNSLLQCKNLITKIKNAINNTQVWITKDINGMVIGIYTENEKRLAITNTYNNLDEFEKRYSKYHTLVNSDINTDVIKYNGIVEFKTEIDFKKHNKHNWKFDDTNNFYSYKLYDDHNDVLLTTFEMFNKKNSKSEFKHVLECIKNKRFTIEFNNINKKYRYILRNKSNETVAYGYEYDTVVEVRKLIENIITLA